MSLTYDVRITGTPALEAALSRIKTAMGTSVYQILDTTAMQIKGDLVATAPMFKGNLKSSFIIQKSSRDSRYIGTRQAGHQYGQAVESGGGPMGYVNIDDLQRRIGGTKKDSFLFARWLKRTGKAIRPPSYFVKAVADESKYLFLNNVRNLLSQVVR